MKEYDLYGSKEVKIVNNKSLNILDQRKKEINNVLLNTEKKIFSGNEKTYSLKEFNEYQNKKRKEIKNARSNN